MLILYLLMVNHNTKRKWQKSDVLEVLLLYDCFLHTLILQLNNNGLLPSIKHYSDFLLATTTTERKINRLVIPSGIFATPWWPSKKSAYRPLWSSCLAKISRYATE